MNAPHLTADLIRRFERAEAANKRLRLENLGMRQVIAAHRARNHTPRSAT